MYRFGIRVRAALPAGLNCIGSWCQVPPTLVATPLLKVVDEHEPHQPA